MQLGQAMQKILMLPTDTSNQTRQMLMMVWWIGIIHFLVEALIMATLSGWHLSRPVIMEGLLDSTLLTLLSTPLIYAWVAKPFITSANDAETALSHTIRDQAEQAATLESTLASLNRSLEQNEDLRIRLQQSNEKIAEINELTLQRIGADLHDGPAQLLTYSLLRLGKFAPIVRKAGRKKDADELSFVQVALTDTLTEVRNISRGLSLPQLSTATLGETIALAVTLHQEQTGTKVDLTTEDLPDNAAQALKVCVYRVVQESLANAYRHGQGRDQKVTAHSGTHLVLTVSDNGPGFDALNYNRDGLGLSGMRARVEALGGTMIIDSKVGSGTSLTIKLDLEHSQMRSAA